MLLPQQLVPVPKLFLFDRSHPVGGITNGTAGTGLQGMVPTTARIKTGPGTLVFGKLGQLG